MSSMSGTAHNMHPQQPGYVLDELGWHRRRNGDDEDEELYTRPKGGRVNQAITSKVYGLASMMPRVLLLPLLSVLLIALMTAIVVPVFMVYLVENKEQAKDTNVWCAVSMSQATSNMKECDLFMQYKEKQVPRDQPLVFIKTRISYLDLIGLAGNLVANIHFAGSLDDGREMLNLPANQSITIYAGGSSITIPGGSQAPLFEFQVDLEASTHLVNYPFDGYVARLNVEASWNRPERSTYVPLIHELKTNLPAFRVQVREPNNNQPAMQVTEKLASTRAQMAILRGNTTRFFSLFIVVAMWALSSSIFVLMVDLVFMKTRRVSTDDAAYIAAMLFALPSVRQVQPGVPDVGASVDVVGFFWNMALTLCAGLLILGRLMGQHVMKKPKHRSAAQHSNASSLPH